VGNQLETWNIIRQISENARIIWLDAWPTIEIKAHITICTMLYIPTAFSVRFCPVCFLPYPRPFPPTITYMVWYIELSALGGGAFDPPSPGWGVGGGTKVNNGIFLAVSKLAKM
jgi:hypothetical protein